MLGREGAFFRDFLMNELVVSIDGLSRLQLAALVERLGLQVCSPCPLQATGCAWPLSRLWYRPDTAAVA